MTADQVRPAQPPQVSGRPTARPGSVVVPTRDPDTGERSTAEISFQDYAALPRDPEGLVMITSPEAEARNINFLPPSDYGTEQGYALEDLLYFGEDNMRERMAQDPGFVERMLRQTLPGQVIGPLSDREQQIVYNQLVEGPNYRGTPFEETGLFEGNLLGSMMGRVFGDQSFDPNAAEYTAVVENGDIVGSLALDAEGNPIGYRGRSVVDPELLDPNVDIDAARDVMPIYDPTAGGDGGEDEQPEEEFVDPCPEGYVYDSQTGTCVIDPTAVVQQEAAQPVATPQPVVTEVAGAYTPVAGLGSVGLMPGAAPNFNIPRAPVAPITVAPQAGLASLRV